jgi:hypothetical protein
MELIKRYQVRGVPGEVNRVHFDGRTVDFWIPRGDTQHLLIAHDGQNVFDGKTSTHRRFGYPNILGLTRQRLLRSGMAEVSKMNMVGQRIYRRNDSSKKMWLSIRQM